jgi:hypothetical protein
MRILIPLATAAFAAALAGCVLAGRPEGVLERSEVPPPPSGAGEVKLSKPAAEPSAEPPAAAPRAGLAAPGAPR